MKFTVPSKHTVWCSRWIGNDSTGGNSHLYCTRTDKVSILELIDLVRLELQCPSMITLAHVLSELKAMIRSWSAAVTIISLPLGASVRAMYQKILHKLTNMENPNEPHDCASTKAKNPTRRFYHDLSLYFGNEEAPVVLPQSGSQRCPSSGPPRSAGRPVDSI